MRLDEGKLRAYLDHALSPAEQRAVEATLAQSGGARQTLARLQRRREDVARHLSSLAPPDTPSAAQALRQLQAQPANPPAHSRPLERMKRMFTTPRLKRLQPAITALTVAAVIALLFSFAPVRAMAGNFLKIFRVQEVKIIPVAMEQVESLKNNQEFQGLMDQFSPSSEVVSGSGEPQRVASLAAAAAQVDFTPLQIATLPGNLAGPRKILVQEQSIAHITLDKELIEAIFQSAGIEISLPDSINEQPLILTQPATVLQSWEGDAGPELNFVQLRTPEIEYPDDLDLQALGIAGLQLLGMSKAEATALGNTIDWANTLVLPIPSDTDMTVTEVTVGGAKGFLFAADTSATTDSTQSALMWQTGGMTYFIAGQFSPDDILAMGRSVGR
ncbi:MAG: anti-sigma factor family protein [Anaerolineae bacterium]